MKTKQLDMQALTVAYYMKQYRAIHPDIVIDFENGDVVVKEKSPELARTIAEDFTKFYLTKLKEDWS